MRFKNILLTDTVSIPQIGFGTYKLSEGGEAEAAVGSALEAGYRHIDTASMYGNEKSIGKAVRTSGIERKEIFITTKVWNSEQGRYETKKALEDSLTRLNMDYVDLYLIHWPVDGKYLETWEEMIALHEDGLARAIGVSNFHEHHLNDILEKGLKKPVINQVELHPYLQQKQLRQFCNAKGIIVESWSPLARARVTEDNVLQEVGRKYGKTEAQITIRWHIQSGLVVIPKSAHKERIQENFNVFDFELDQADMQALNNLDENMRTGVDPESFS